MVKLNLDTPVALEKLETFADGLDHSEGIAITPNGDLFVGGEAGQLYQIIDEKPVEVANTGGFLLGLASDSLGRIYAIDVKNQKVWRYDQNDKSLSDFAIGPDGNPFSVPNWGTFDSLGNYYLTDSGGWMANEGRIWIIRPGSQPEIWSEASKAFPNGCCISHDGTKLIIVESVPGAIIEIPPSSLL